MSWDQGNELRGEVFCALNLRVDGAFFSCSNQEGFDAVIKNVELMGVPRDVNSPGKSGVERTLETKALFCLL